MRERNLAGHDARPTVMAVVATGSRVVAAAQRAALPATTRAIRRYPRR